MSNIIRFPVKARIASNDSNPWLSSGNSPAEMSAKVEPVETPIYAKPCKVVDEVSGVEYTGYVIEDEKDPRDRAWLFVLAIFGWLLIFALV